MESAEETRNVIIDLQRYGNETCCGTNSPYHVKTINMNHHFGALEIVELLANGGLLLRRKPRPRPVGSTVIILSIGHFDVVIEPYDLFRQVGLSFTLINGTEERVVCTNLSGFEFFDRWPETEFTEQGHLFLFSFLLLFSRTGSCNQVNQLTTRTDESIKETNGNLLLRMLRSSNSSCVGRRLSRLLRCKCFFFSFIKEKEKKNALRGIRTWSDGHRRLRVEYGAPVQFVREEFPFQSIPADPVSWPVSMPGCLYGLSGRPISLFSECRVHDMVVENNFLNHVYLLPTCSLRRHRDRGSARPTRPSRSRTEREW